MDWTKFFEANTLVPLLTAILVAVPGWPAFWRIKRKDKAEATDLITGAATKLIDRLETRLGLAQKSIDSLEIRLGETKAELDRTRCELNVARDELNELRRGERLKTRDLATYVAGAGILINQVRTLGVEPDWSPPEIRETAVSAD
jgi:septal ring factor EnvC (AmiA/AmiB activator)